MLSVKGIGLIIWVAFALIIAFPQVNPIYSSTESGYSVTVNIGEHPFGNKHSYIWIETEDGWKDSVKLATAGDPSYTFEVPAGYGDSVQVCASSAIVALNHCQTFTAGEDFYIELDVPALLN
jgi:desulfoferrodoxin (superoxide reductase-like protein)